MKLSAMLQEPSVKASIVADCAQLIETQVNTKGGISGLALKAAYTLVKGLNAHYIPGAIGRLLPQLFEALNSMWEEGTQAGDPVAYLVKHRSRTADTILSVTDSRVKNSPAVVKSTYGKMRASVQGDVEEAIPELAQILGKHMYAIPQP
jgi:hypothetical protein